MNNTPNKGDLYIQHNYSGKLYRIMLITGVKQFIYLNKYTNRFHTQNDVSWESFECAILKNKYTKKVQK